MYYPGRKGFLPAIPKKSRGPKRFDNKLEKGHLSNIRREVPFFSKGKEGKGAKNDFVFALTKADTEHKFLLGI